MGIFYYRIYPIVRYVIIIAVPLLGISYLTGSPQASLRLRSFLGIDIPKEVSESPQTHTQPTTVESPENRSSITPISGSPTPTNRRSSDSPGKVPLLQPHHVIIDTSEYWSWALLNTRTGTIVGSTNFSSTSDTASLIKAWIAADYLRYTSKKEHIPDEKTLEKISLMIRDSDNANATMFHNTNGGLASITRMISTCGLTDSSGVRESWSLTRMSSRDIARLGACLGDGRAAGPVWTGWLLNEMRSVRGIGRFGVIQALPSPIAAKVAIKNGWLLRDEDNLWHINCMAISDGWVLGVQTRYAGSRGMDYGTRICRLIGEQLMA